MMGHDIYKLAAGKVIVHVGLPKTATSALQIDYFPKIAGAGVIYAGVDGYRRHNFNKPIYEKFIASVVSGDGVYDVNNELSNCILGGETLLISEEMITVSSNGVTWAEKLANLAKVLDGLEYKIIVTVREPVSALFSYFVELYPRYIGSRFIDVVTDDYTFKIFYYSELINQLLTNFEKERVVMVKFEDIIRQDLRILNQLFKIPRNEDGSVLVNNRNAREGSKGYVIRQTSITNGQYIYFFLKKLSIGRIVPPGLKDRLRPIYKPISKWIMDGSIITTKISKPSDVDICQLQKALKYDIDFLRKEFGVDYRE